MPQPIRTNDTACPACGKNINAASSVTGDEEGPGPGALSICLGCATPLVFNDDMSLRLASEEEADEFPEGSIEMVKTAIVMRQSLEALGLDPMISMFGIRAPDEPQAKPEEPEPVQRGHFQIEDGNPDSMIEALLGMNRMLCQNYGLDPYDGFNMLMRAAILQLRSYSAAEDVHSHFIEAAQLIWGEVDGDYEFAPARRMQ